MRSTIDMDQEGMGSSWGSQVKTSCPSSLLVSLFSPGRWSYSASLPNSRFFEVSRKSPCKCTARKLGAQLTLCFTWLLGYVSLGPEGMPLGCAEKLSWKYSSWQGDFRDTCESFPAFENKQTLTCFPPLLPRGLESFTFSWKPFIPYWERMFRMQT